MKNTITPVLIAALGLSTTALVGCVDEGDGVDVDTLQREGAGRASPALAAKRHCTVEAVATREGELVPVGVALPQPRCFDSFAEAIAAATRGTVRLPADATPEALDRLDADQAASLATYLIAIEYLGLYWDGYWGSYVVSSSVNCDQGYSLSYSNLQGLYASNGWPLNDSIGSVRTYPGCRHAYHYDYANFGGAMIDCPSSPEWNCYYGMGAMNDRTSSIRWSNY